MMSSTLIGQSLEIYKAILLLTPEQRIFVRYEFSPSIIAELGVVGITLRSYSDIEDLANAKGLNYFETIRLSDQIALVSSYLRTEQGFNTTDCPIPYHLFSKVAHERANDKNFSERAVGKLFQAIPQKYEFRQWVFIGHATIKKMPWTCSGKHQVAIWRDMETLNAHSE